MLPADGLVLSRGRIESINVSRGGVPKVPVPEALVNSQGLAGDFQRDLRDHGGPERAVSLYSLQLIEALRSEGHPIAPGTAGENVTVSGIDWSAVVPGRRIQLGPVQLVVTGYAAPCETIAHSFLDEDFLRISQKIHPGWSRVYTRVAAGGRIRTGDHVLLTEPHDPPAPRFQ
jgi:MOSC domain-containing protein YiiM